METSLRRQRIETAAQSHIDSRYFSGIEWLVMRGGETWSRGKLGWADAIEGVEMPRKPIYRVFSMTKPVVSAVALMLMEQGKLRLYTPIAAYLPEFGSMNVIAEDGTRQAAKVPITVEHLLTHRAGLSYGFLADCPAGQLYRQSKMKDASFSLADMVTEIAGLPLAFEPGSQWRYSVATDVLARVIEVILGRALPEILQEFVFVPLGMAETGYSVPEPERHRLMAMFGKSDIDTMLEFDDLPQSLVPADMSELYPADNPDFYRGGYGLFSTIDDYSLLTSFLASGLSSRGERLLSRKTVELMWTNRVPDSQMPLRVGPIALPGYGHGLAGRVLVNPGQAFGLTSVGECGWAGAASTYFWIDKQEELTGIVMAQYLGSKVPLQDDIRNAVYQALDD